MKTHNVAAIALAAAGLLWADAASANIVQLNYAYNPAQVTNVDEAAFARYRLNQTNWDQAIGYDPPIAIAQEKNIGNLSQLNNVQWFFELSYNFQDVVDPNPSVYTFTLYQNGVGPHTVSFVGPAYEYGKPQQDQYKHLPTESFNAINLSAVAGGFKGGTTGTMSMSIINLEFAGAGLTTTGSLNNMFIVDAATSTSNQQWIFADVDLSKFDWTLTGKVLGSFAFDQCPNGKCQIADEGLKFNISTKDVTVVPVPAALPIIGAALAGFGFAGWRQRKAAA